MRFKPWLFGRQSLTIFFFKGIPLALVFQMLDESVQSRASYKTPDFLGAPITATIYPKIGGLAILSIWLRSWSGTALCLQINNKKVAKSDLLKSLYRESSN